MKKFKLGLLAISTLMVIPSLIGCQGVFGEQTDLTTNIGVISYSARKYNNRMTRKKISSSIGKEEVQTQKDLFAALYYSFKDSMPELDNVRKSLGRFDESHASSSGSEAYDFFLEKGLLDENEKYNPNEIVNKNYISVLLERIHTYIGISYVDDFATAANHDFIYDSNREYKQEPDVYSSLLDTNIVSEKINSIVAMTKKEGSIKTRTLVDLFDMKGKTFTIQDETLFNNLIQNNRNITSVDEYYSWEKSASKATVGSTLFYINQSMPRPTNGENVDTDKNWFVPVQPGTLMSCIFNSSIVEMTETDIAAIIANNTAWAYFNYYLPQYDVSEAVFGCAKFALSMHEIKKTFSNPFENEKWYPISNYDPFILEEITGDYSFNSAFFPNSLVSFNDDFYIQGKTLYDYMVFAKAMKNSANIRYLKDLSLACFFDNSLGYLASVGNGITLTEPIITALADYMIITSYQKTDEYRKTVTAMRELFSNKLKPALKEMFNRSSWLSKEGNIIATEKLNNMTSSFIFEAEGHNLENPKAYDLVLDKGMFAILASYQQSYWYGFLTTLDTYGYDLNFISFYYYSPLTPNAYYLPTNNSFSIYAGFSFSRKPIYEMTEEEVLAEYGVLIGHEMTHGFDSYGITFDKNGNSVTGSILPKEDVDKYNSLVTKMKNYYDGAETTVGIATIGQTVMNEAIADQGGLNTCLTVAKKNNKFNYEYFFYDLAAHFYQGGNRPYLLSYKNDPHPMGKVRVNKLLSNNAKFIETFNIKEGDLMYLSPDNQFTVW